MDYRPVSAGTAGRKELQHRCNGASQVRRPDEGHVRLQDQTMEKCKGLRNDYPKCDGERMENMSEEKKKMT